ncbi:MAG TPA: KOW domain-containing RNA-binding protein [Syntrophomonadaceae bacterium]|nr:KOW domain-containing RNA-binding protein [Syntrophomonadaceae bacterium]
MEVKDIGIDILGKVVISKSGRDKGKAFVVIGILNERFLLICDGDIRKIENPKKKNTRHLSFTSMQAHDVLEYLQKGEKPPNHIIRKSLKQLIDKGLNLGEGGLENG